jgi:NADPH-dependent F420 reductase
MRDVAARATSSVPPNAICSAERAAGDGGTERKTIFTRQFQERTMIEQVAIIGGTGPEGRGLAVRWARAGVRVIIGSREENRARIVAQEIAHYVPGAQVTGAENAAAVAACGVAVLAVPFEAQVATLKSLKSAFRPGAVLICATVPLATSVGDRGSRTLGVWQGSAAEQAADFVPESVKVAGALQNISAALLSTNRDLDCDVIVCSDDKRAKEIATELARLIPGVRAVDGGPLENARIVEQITALLVGINIRYKAHGGGIRITGIPDL